MTAFEFSASPGFMLRTPLLPLSVWIEWAADGSIEQQRALLHTLLEDPRIRDALFVASPDLFEGIATWKREPDSRDGQKVERALTRYLSRMCARPTPFGLFSGVSAGTTTGETTQLQVGDPAGYERHTRLDNDYLFALCEALQHEPTLRAALPFAPNSSLYRAAGRIRYAEARLQGTNRTYHLVSIVPDDYLEATLDRAAGGAPLATLAAALVEDDPEIELEEAQAYVAELAQTQVLVSPLTPPVTGEEPVVGVLETLGSVEAGSGPAQILADAQRRLEAIDASGLGAPDSAYREIAQSLEALPAPVELSRLFQVDMVKPAASTLGPETLDTIARAVQTLHSIGRGGVDESLSAFRDAFIRRYEDAEVPLTEVLDEESGIGFETSGAPAAEAAPLIAGLPIGRRNEGTRTVPWPDSRAWLLRRVTTLEGSELVLDDEDIERLRPKESRPPLADAFSIMPTLLPDGRIFLESGGGGPSGARIMGRFCHASQAIHTAVREHLRQEEARRPDAVFAEIVHLNEGRIGNIQCRPVLREYEIPFLGRSGARKRIPITDLTVAVRRGRVVLRSKSLDREVLPRMATAHNYRLRSMGIYRFLCSLQSQGTTGFGWSWGPLDALAHLPRVRWRDVIFSRERWRLSAKEVESIASAAKGKVKTTDQVVAQRQRVWDAVQKVRAERNLPRYVVVADGDNELPVDLDNQLTVDSFAHLIKRRGSVGLLEMLPGPEDLVAEGPDGRFTHQLALSYVRHGEPPAPETPRAPAPMHRYHPGDRWLYAQIYAGWTTIDDVLRDAVAPTNAEVAGAFDRWFFLRYSNPDPHLRVRWRGEPARLLGEVLPALHRALEPFRRSGAVWKVQLDTYVPEIERYGGAQGIGPSEVLFAADSDAVLGIVEHLEGDEGADARWRLAVRGSDMVLSDLGLDEEARFGVFTRARASFGAEFGIDVDLERQLGKKFRDERKWLEGFLARDPARDEADPLAPGLELLDARTSAVTAVAAQLRTLDEGGALNQPLREIAWSYVHMHCNRLLRSAQRAQELVIYDLLARHYKSLIARRKKRAK